jgi:DNA-directed RNA polymerase specialized sigma24 family protein
MAASQAWGLSEGAQALGGFVDREAVFERFAAEHQDRALQLAVRLVAGDRAAAEDIVQEAFLRANRGLAPDAR